MCDTAFVQVTDCRGQLAKVWGCPRGRETDRDEVGEVGHDNTAVGLNRIGLDLVYVGRGRRRRLTGHNLE